MAEDCPAEVPEQGGVRAGVEEEEPEQGGVSHRKRTHHLGQGPGFLDQCQACNEVSGEYFLRN